MGTANTKHELMRETVIVEYVSGQSGVKNSVFDITIPEGYALELHTVDFLMKTNEGMVAQRTDLYLVDDPDETASPGHNAEKVIQSVHWHYELTTTGAAIGWFTKSMDCHRTLLVQNANLITDVQTNPAADFNLYARIWFKFVKISPKQILDLLRQQQY